MQVTEDIPDLRPTVMAGVPRSVCVCVRVCVCACVRVCECVYRWVGGWVRALAYAGGGGGGGGLERRFPGGPRRPDVLTS